MNATNDNQKNPIEERRGTITVFPDPEKEAWVRKEFFEVLSRFPENVRNTLTNHWRDCPPRNPFTGKDEPAPFLMLSDYETASQQMGVGGYGATGGSDFFLDADIILASPSEARGALLAVCIADAYGHALHGESWTEREERIEEIYQRVEAVGYHYADLDLWRLTKSANPTGDSLPFYMERWWRVGYRPPAELVSKMDSLFRAHGAPQFARALTEGADISQVLKKPTLKRFQKNSEIFHEKEHACEHCGFRHLTDYHSLQIPEPGVEPANDPARTVILCEPCRLSLDWARFVLGPEREASVILDWIKDLKSEAKNRVESFVQGQAAARQLLAHDDSGHAHQFGKGQVHELTTDGLRQFAKLDADPDQETWLRKEFLNVIRRLPAEPARLLTQFYSTYPPTNPLTMKQESAPFVMFLAADHAKLVGQPLMIVKASVVYLFNEEIFYMPHEAQAALIAKELADSYLSLVYPERSQAAGDTSDQSKLLIQSWGIGINHLDHDVWLMVKQRFDSSHPDRHLEFYIERFSEFGYRPPHNFTKKVRNYLIKRGDLELSKALDASLSVYPRSTHFKQTAERLRGFCEYLRSARGHLCERCRTTQMLDCYHVHDPELFPEFATDDEGILVLCFPCASQFQWHDSVYGDSDRHQLIDWLTPTAKARVVDFMKRVAGASSSAADAT